MPAVALSDGNSEVACTDGVRGTQCAPDPPRWLWDVGSTHASAAATVTDIFIEGINPVVFGDQMTSHPWGEPCTPSPVPHTPSLNTIIGSPNVYFGGKPAARIGDKYNSESFDHTITTGASTVFIG
jgi:uncharacterized Zn-binding protein involved in type VI secretion